MIRLEGLNKEQVEMLDKIWSIDTFEELEEFRAGLPKFRRQQIDTLMQLIMMEYQEEDLQQMQRFPEAEKIFKKIAERG